MSARGLQGQRGRSDGGRLSGYSEDSVRRVSPPSGERPEPHWHQSPYRRYCGQLYILQGGAQERQSGILDVVGGRRGAAGGGGVSVKVLVLS